MKITKSVASVNVDEKAKILLRNFNRVWNKRTLDFDRFHKEKIIIHCDTKEKSRDLLEFLNELGVKWCFRNINLLEYDPYYNYVWSENTICYSMSKISPNPFYTLSLESKGFFMELGYEIYEWEII